MYFSITKLRVRNNLDVSTSIISTLIDNKIATKIKNTKNQNSLTLMIIQ